MTSTPPGVPPVAPGGFFFLLALELIMSKWTIVKEAVRSIWMDECCSAYDAWREIQDSSILAPESKKHRFNKLTALTDARTLVRVETKFNLSPRNAIRLCEMALPQPTASASGWKTPPIAAINAVVAGSSCVTI